MMEIPEKIFLMGFMGCGKTTHGKKLAKKLNRPFIDLDHYIERKENKTIPEIFNLSGENAFREMEALYLKQVISRYASAVISLGGGTPCFNNNIDIINTSGLSIYIEMTSKALFQRLENAATARPLLAGKSSDEKLKTISDLLEVRENFYKQAAIKVNGINLDTEKLIEALSLFIGNP